MTSSEWASVAQSAIAAASALLAAWLTSGRGANNERLKEMRTRRLEALESFGTFFIDRDVKVTEFLYSFPLTVIHKAASWEQLRKRRDASTRGDDYPHLVSKLELLGFSALAASIETYERAAMDFDNYTFTVEAKYVEADEGEIGEFVRKIGRARQETEVELSKAYRSCEENRFLMKKPRPAV